MTPCEEKGYEVGQVFEVIGGNGDAFTKDSIIALAENSGSDCPSFDLIKGNSNYRHGVKTERGAYITLCYVKRIYPPEEETKDVEVVCEGNTTTLCRRDAKRLGLI